MRLRTILHPTDLTASSRPALDQAVALARDYRTQLVILHAADLLLPRPAALPPGYARRRQQLGDELRQLIVPDPLVNVEYILSEDDAVSAIVRTAAARDCDLIVMGSSTPRALPGLLPAGVAEQVIRWAHCPVLVVKPPGPVEPPKDRPVPAVARVERLAGGRAR